MTPPQASELATTGFSAAYGDWDLPEFSRNGQAVLDLICRYFADIREMPVSRDASPSDLYARLAGEPPQVAEDFTEILTDTQSMIMPYLTHWNHPRFHAYFSITGSLPGVLADTVTSALNVNAMLWQASPAASALEKTVLGWVAGMLDLPPETDGVLVNGASLATLYALAAAREAVPELRVREHGLTGYGRRLRLYTSDQAHSSVDKAAITLGIGLENVVRVPSDDGYALRGAAVEAAVRADLADGHRPFAVVATVGTTSVAADDDVGELAEVCRRHGLWLHVDAAYGGLWRLAESVAPGAPDLTMADSVVANPHKVLYTPLEVTALYCRRRDMLPNVFRLVPEYLRTADQEGAVDYMNYSPQLGRGFRALKLWWVIRSFGVTGLANRLQHSVDLARWLRAAVAEDPGWECPVDSRYPLVCLRYVPRSLRERYAPDAVPMAEIERLNADIVARVNASGSAYVSHAVLRDGYVLRVSIGNIRTGEQDVRLLWDLLRREAANAEDGPW